MKKLFCIAATMFLAVGAFAQGQFTLGNSSATAITNALTGARPNVGDIVVALYGNLTLGLGQNDSSLTQVGATAPLSSPGRFSDGARDIGGAGQVVTLQVRAWSAAYATYNAAVAAGALAGKSNVWEEQASFGGANPPNGITGPGQLQPFLVTAVPEPSTIALGVLGLGAVAFLRRRKQ